MDHRHADLFPDSSLTGADRFNILLIKHDVIWTRREVKKCSSWSWAHHGRDPEAAAFAAPIVLMAGSEEYLLPEQPRCVCDCEIVVEASRVSPRLP